MTAPASHPLPELDHLYDEVSKCGRCGFCQPTCPVYSATGKEAHVARGKNALFRGLIEGRTALEPDLRDAFDNCLLCRACTANCFTAVKTDRLVVAFRETYGDRRGRATVQRWIFRGLLPYPRRMAWLIGLLWTARRLGLAGAAQRLGLLRMVNPKLEKAMAIRDEVPGRFLRARLKRRRRPAAAPGSPRVGYWISCGYNYMLPEVGEATVEVLERAGLHVEVLPNNCCGLPVYGYGDLAGARLLARKNLERIGDLARYDYIVSDCGSCSGHLKEYGELLRDDPEWAERAEVLTAKVRGFSELADELGLPHTLGLDRERQGSSAQAAGGPDTPPPPKTITYHDPCHLGPRYQNVVDQPRRLLRALPGVRFRELPEADWCCGAAGSYNFMHNDISMKILERKAENLASTEADVVATECPACLMQLSLGAKRYGLATRVVSVSQLLCEAARRQAGR